MTGLIDAAFSRTRVIALSFVVLVCAGLAAFITIPRESEPDIAAPFVLVTLPLPGISPEDGDRLLVRPTQIELQTIDGLKELNAVSYDGAAQIILEFQTTTDMDQAVVDVREAVDRAKSEYPADAEEPIVEEFNVQNQFPILTLVFYGDVPERTLYKIVKNLQDKLESAPGVLEVNLLGAREELLEVIVDPEVIESYGLTELEVVNAVTQNNQLVTAGTLNMQDGQFAVKAPGLVKSAQDLMNTPIRVDGEGIITASDVASIRRSFVDRQGYAIFNGKPAIAINVSKRVGANIVKTIVTAREIVEIEAKQWPSSVQYAVFNDASIEVSDNLEGLTASVLTAVFLVMVVIVAALGLRPGLMVGIAIPGTFLMTFLFLYMQGYTLNMMVMFALVLAVGMLVDGAIVIVEYADRRMGEGADRRTAYLEVSKRMFWPVITSTATTLAAFVPFLFWKDTVGEFMKYLPITLIAVLLCSLLVALIFLPVLGSLLGLPTWMKEKFNLQGKTGGPAITKLEETDPRQRPNLIGGYTRLLTNLIQRPGLAILTAFCIIVACGQIFKAASPDIEFFIRANTERLNILILARGNLSAEQKIGITKEVAARIEHHSAIEYALLQTGPELSRNSELPSETIGQIGINLTDSTKRPHSNLVMKDLRDLLADIPGIHLEVREEEPGPVIGKDVQVELSALSYEQMFKAAHKVRNFAENATMEINGMPTEVFMDIEDTLPLPGIEWNMEIDREQAGRYGLSIAQAGASLQMATNGLLVDRYRPDDSDEEIDIRARFPEQYRNISTLDQIRVQTAQGGIPLSNFITRTAKQQVDRVARRDGRRILDVKANANTRTQDHIVSQDQAIAVMRDYLESGALGDHIEWKILGADEETAAAMAFFTSAMLAALFLIAMILLLEFNSFYHSALTLTAVILSVYGVLLGVAVSGQYISVIMTGVGIVALAGIVVNNNIVLIDTYQHLRKKGLAVEEAVIRTAAQRVRPVLLTTCTTILGLLPMVFELNVDFAAGEITHGTITSSWWVLLSSAVVYGLAFSTILTLLLTPILLAAPTIFQRRLVALKSKIFGPPDMGKPYQLQKPGSAQSPQAAE